MIGLEDTPKRIFDRSSVYLTNNSPTLKYRAGSQGPNAHWGQLKLMMTELLFLSDNYNTSKHTKPVVVYAGAAHGDHIPILSKMFPKIRWILYDPSKFNITSDDKITIVNEFYTNDVSEQIKERADEEGWDIFFISDIRLAPEDGDNPDDVSYEKESQIEEDMKMQEGWHNILKPVASLLKFRIPYTITEVNGEFKYLPGELMIQPFPPRFSGESRLVVKENNVQVNFGTRWYEEVMFYHNIVTRPHYEYEPLTKSEKGSYFPSLRRDYDSMWVTYASMRYTEWVKSNMGKDLNVKEETEVVSKYIVDSLTEEVSKRGENYPIIPFKRALSISTMISKLIAINNNDMNQFSLPRDLIRRMTGSRKERPSLKFR